MHQMSIIRSFMENNEHTHKHMQTDVHNMSAAEVSVSLSF